MSPSCKGVLKVCISPSPAAQIIDADRDAENIGWNKTQLSGFDANDAHDNAINGCHDPAFRAPPSHQDCGGDG
jgi:hypothetical protein